MHPKEKALIIAFIKHYIDEKKEIKDKSFM